jgi:hypothetical protein
VFHLMAVLGESRKIYGAYGDTMAGAGLGAGVKRDDNTASPDRTAANTPAATQRQRSWSDALATPLRCIAAAAMLGFDNKTEGGLYPDGTDGSLQRALGRKLSGVITPEGGGTVAIRIMIKSPTSPTGLGIVWGSATIIDEYNVVTAAHHFTGRDVVSIDVRTGPNFRTDPGTIHKVEKWHVNPAYVNDASRGRELDIAMLNLATPMNTLRPKFSTGRPAVGSQVALCGFGRDGTPSGGLRPSATGDPLAGTSEVDSDLSAIVSGQSPELYVGTIFWRTGVPGALRAAPGDSGGTVFVLNEQSRVLSIAGMIVSTSIPINSVFTFFLDLTLPTVRNYIDIHKKKVDVRLAISHSSDGVLVTWPQTSDFVLQTSFNPDGVWNNYTNTITNNEGVSRVVVSHPAKESYQFFRLVRK